MQRYDWWLHKWNVYDARFNSCTTAQLPTSGFSSLYAVTAEDAALLTSTATSGFKGSVWSKTLWLDFDSKEAGLRAWSRVAELGLAAELWDSGNKGYHIGISRPHSPSHLLPAIDKEWVKANFPEADSSIYTHLHLFRLPHSFNEKGGRCKELIEKREGSELLLPDTVEERQFTAASEYPESSIFLNSYIMDLTLPQLEGNRHQALMKLGLMLKRNGEPMEFVCRWLYHANLLSSTPKPQDELERLIDFVASATVG